MTVNRIATALLIVVAVAIRATPLAAYSCISSNIANYSCHSCCAKKSCCAVQGKKTPSAPQPLATNAAGHELLFSISPGPLAIAYDFSSGTSVPKQTRDLSGNAPPKRALLCTFLI
jgi:hypothetical protein